MSYENFAYYYDSLMDDQFYQDYYQFINQHAKFKSVLELGCGTGEIAILLAKDKKQVYATDLSKDMLEVARMKAMDANVDLLLGRIDMTDFDCAIEGMTKCSGASFAEETAFGVVIVSLFVPTIADPFLKSVNIKPSKRKVVVINRLGSEIEELHY